MSMAIPKVLCWALIFILKLCFPPGQSLAYVNIFKFTSDIKPKIFYRQTCWLNCQNVRTKRFSVPFNRMSLFSLSFITMSDQLLLCLRASPSLLDSVDCLGFLSAFYVFSHFFVVVVVVLFL